MDSLNRPEPQTQAQTGITTTTGTTAAPAGEESQGESYLAWVLRAVIPLLGLVLAILLIRGVLRLDGFEGILNVAKVVLGLGFVIFIHELGHFAVAKWCDVHVQAFSLGFLGHIPGCRFRWGETEYKIGWLPLGGYVKMVGEGAEDEEGGADDPRSFKNKTVWQRMAIISAGVVMNAAFAFVAFSAIFWYEGFPKMPGLIGAVDVNSALWRQGVPSGSKIAQIGNVENPTFDEIKPLVALSAEGQQLPFDYRPYDQPDTVVQTTIVPRLDPGGMTPVIGFSPAEKAALAPEEARKQLRRVTEPGSPAEKASPPFEFGDALVGTTDPDNPDRLKPLPPHPFTPGDPDVFEFRRRLARLAGKEMVVQVRRAGAPREGATVEIKVPPAYHYTFPGLRMRMGKVAGVREGSSAEGKIPEGATVKYAEVIWPDGGRTRYVTAKEANSAQLPANVTARETDPLRLPDHLNAWADQVPGPKRVAVGLLGRADPVELTWDERFRFSQELALYKTSPWSVPALGIAYRVDNYVEETGDAPAVRRGGLQPGDRIVAVRFKVPDNKPGEYRFGDWVELGDDQWAHVFWRLQQNDAKEAEFRYKRGEEIQEFAWAAEPDPTWPAVERGLRLTPDRITDKAQTLGEAVRKGGGLTLSSAATLLRSLRSMVMQRVSHKQLGGPITIAATAYSMAGDSFWTFLYFLGFISINLAVINFLPIPLLDGGHMVFLIYELVRGKPASEAVRVWLSYVGLFLLLSLMFFVFYLDVNRFSITRFLFSQ